MLEKPGVGAHFLLVGSEGISLQHGNCLLDLHQALADMQQDLGLILQIFWRKFFEGFDLAPQLA